MKKKDVLRYLPQARTLAKQASIRLKEGNRITNEALKILDIVDNLKGITLHENFPLKITHYGQDYDIMSGCSEVYRSAYVRKTPEGYTVTTYKNNLNEMDGTPIEGVFQKRSEALSAAKHFVATGKKTSGRMASR